MNILLIGGNGFLGQHLLKAINLSEIGDITLTIGARHDGQDQIAIDLNDPIDYPKLRSFGIVINCAGIRPDRYAPLIRFCLDNGIRFLETVADPAILRLLLQLKEQFAGPASGLFLFGVGIFPGFSNLLIKKTLAENTGGTAIDLGIQYKVMSGAGRGMCRLMADTIGAPCHWFEQGRERESAVPFFSLGQLSFDTRNSTSIQLTLGELYTMHALLPEGSARSYISFQPVWLNRPCYYLFNAISYLGFFKKPALRLLYGSFYLVRGILLKNRKTDIHLLCRVTGATTSQCRTWFNDAFLAAGFFTTALLRLLQTDPFPTGCHGVEDLYSLDTVLPLMAALGKNTLEYEYA